MCDNANSFFTHSGSSPPEERKQVYSTSTKSCTRCKKKKPSTEFYSKGNRLGSRCKGCIKAAKKKKYKMKKLSEKARMSNAKQIVDLGKVETFYTDTPLDLKAFEQFVLFSFTSVQEEVAA